MAKMNLGQTVFGIRHNDSSGIGFENFLSERASQLCRVFHSGAATRFFAGSASILIPACGRRRTTPDGSPRFKKPSSPLRSRRLGQPGRLFILFRKRKTSRTRDAKHPRMVTPRAGTGRQWRIMMAEGGAGGAVGGRNHFCCVQCVCGMESTLQIGESFQKDRRLLDAINQFISPEVARTRSITLGSRSFPPPGEAVERDGEYRASDMSRGGGRTKKSPTPNPSPPRAARVGGRGKRSRLACCTASREHSSAIALPP
jgi:hypothetical protein